MVPKLPIFNQNKSESEVESESVRHAVGLIEALVNTIDFTQMSTALLVRRKNGDILVPKPLRPPTVKVTCPTWKRLIDEREIETTDWLDALNRRGRWNNMDVELWFGHDDGYLRFVQNLMVGLRVLWQRNLDLHFKVLGHLMRDGDVIGIVMEPNSGRYVEVCDRALVYNTFYELQKNNLVFTWPEFDISSVKIVDGKVRFHTRNVQSIKDVTRERDPERLARARQTHWDALESMLRSLDEMCRWYGGSNPTEAIELAVQRTARLLAYIPFPERPLLLDIQFSTDYYSSIIWSRHRRSVTRKTQLLLLSKCDDYRDIDRDRDRDVPQIQYEPYWLPDPHYASTSSDVSDPTSTTETDLSTGFGVFAHVTTS